MTEKRIEEKDEALASALIFSTETQLLDPGPLLVLFVLRPISRVRTNQIQMRLTPASSIIMIPVFLWLTSLG